MKEKINIYPVLPVSILSAHADFMKAVLSGGIKQGAQFRLISGAEGFQYSGFDTEFENIPPITEKKALAAIHDYFTSTNQLISQYPPFIELGFQRLFPMDRLSVKSSQLLDDTNSWKISYEMRLNAGLLGEAEVVGAELDIEINAKGLIRRVKYRLPLLSEAFSTDSFSPPESSDMSQELVYISIPSCQCYSPFYYVKEARRLFPASCFVNYRMIAPASPEHSLSYKPSEPGFFRNNADTIGYVWWGILPAENVASPLTVENTYWEYEVAQIPVVHRPFDYSKSELVSMAKRTLHQLNLQLRKAKILNDKVPEIFPLSSLNAEAVLPSLYPDNGMQYGWTVIFYLYLRDAEGQLLNTLRAVLVTLGPEGELLQLRSELPDYLIKSSTTKAIS